MESDGEVLEASGTADNAQTRRRSSHPTHSEEIEPPAAKRSIEEAGGVDRIPVPTVDPSNALEVALEKFGLTTLSETMMEKQDRFETYVQTIFKDFEERLNDQRQSHKERMDTHADQIQKLQESYIELRQTVEDLRSPDTGALDSQMKDSASGNVVGLLPAPQTLARAMNFPCWGLEDF